ncbi:MAG: hypothetical protein RL557_862 [archaeon]|jgi:hypothetical protein
MQKSGQSKKVMKGLFILSAMLVIVMPSILATMVGGGVDLDIAIDGESDVDTDGADVLYVTKFKYFDQSVIHTLEDLGLTVNVMMDHDLNEVDFDDYQFVFLSEGRMTRLSEIPDDMPMIIANHYHAKHFGIIERGNLVKVAAKGMLKALDGDDVIETYEQDSEKLGGVALSYYYIPDKFKGDAYIGATQALAGSRGIEGDVVAFSNNSRRCFFGATEGKYWTSDTADLFDTCVSYVLGDIAHDVAIDETYANSLNGIRIQDDETGNYLLDETAKLTCNKKYKVDFRTVNNGDFTEDVTFTGALSTFNWTATKEDLKSNQTTTTGSKTITASFARGTYDLTVKAEIPSDVHLSDNTKTRRVEVLC